MVSDDLMLISDAYRIIRFMDWSSAMIQGTHKKAPTSHIKTTYPIPPALIPDTFYQPLYRPPEAFPRPPTEHGHVPLNVKVLVPLFQDISGTFFLLVFPSEQCLALRLAHDTVRDGTEHHHDANDAKLGDGVGIH